MFTFNQNEQIAILVLAGLLIVDLAISTYGYFWPDDIEEFGIRKAALPVPDTFPRESHPASQKTQPININTAAADALTTRPQVVLMTVEQQSDPATVGAQ